MISDSSHQRLFRAYDHHSDLVRQTKPPKLRKIKHIQGYILSLYGCARIARRNE